MKVVVNDLGSTLELDGPWSEEARHLVETGVADGVVLNYAKGFFAEDLEFLRGLPLRRVDILARWIEELSPLESLGSTLVDLRIQASPRARVDLGALPHLTYLSSEWSAVEISWTWQSPGLRALVLGNYPLPDLDPLDVGPSLKSLTFTGNCGLVSLGGLQVARSLQHLSVGNARGLQDISALQSPNAASLEDLRLESCRGLTSLDALSGLTNLRRLNVANCGPIQSTGPLRGLAALEKLHAWESTNFLDGDLSPLAEMPHLAELRMKARRHYRPPVAELQELIAARISSAEVNSEGV